jgi:5-methylcytosine-specific restriction endonuclease McrA
MILLFQGKVEILEEHDEFIRTVRFTYRIPSVLRLNHYVRQRKRQEGCVRFSRENVYIRDAFCCQYCGEKFQAKNLTLDHVVPLVQGGRKTWTNIVTACIACNQKKGGRTPVEAKMQLLLTPLAPTWLPKVQVDMATARTPASWRGYLFPVRLK